MEMGRERSEGGLNSAERLIAASRMPCVTSVPTEQRLRRAMRLRGAHASIVRSGLHRLAGCAFALAAVLVAAGMCHAACTGDGGIGCTGSGGVGDFPSPVVRSGGGGAASKGAAHLLVDPAFQKSRRQASVDAGCDCGAGHTCAGDNRTCIACPIGSFKPAHEGASYDPSCAYGPAGACFFKWQTGCIACDRGTESKQEASDSCTACRPGHYKSHPGTWPCSPCPPGTFSAAEGAMDASACLACPTDSTSAEGSSALSDCRCHPEFYRSVSDSGTVSCNRCPLGAICRTDGFRCALEDDAKTCPSTNGSRVGIVGTWERTGESGAGPYELLSCPDGFSKSLSSHDDQECVQCGRGNYILRPDEDECQACPPGLVCDGTSAVASDLDGSVWEAQGGIMRLTACPAGYAIHNIGANGTFDATVQQCVDVAVCMAGFENVNGSCLPCGAGKFRDTKSATASCGDCPANTYRSETGGASVDDCHACPAFSSTRGSTGAINVSACECDGRFYLAVDGSSQRPRCETCPYGGLCPGSRDCALGLADMDCGGDGDKDIVGEWAVEADGSYMLASCPDGHTHRKEGNISVECVACSGPHHYILRPDEDECQACPPGLVCDGTSAVASDLDGSVWEAQGGIMRLTACPAGYAIHNIGANGMFDATVQQCVSCSIGFENVNGSCLPCGAGKFRDTKSATASCGDCPANTYRSETGGASVDDCHACPAFSSTRGSTGAINVSACECDGRFYLAVDGSSQRPRCETCPYGGLCPGSRDCALGLADMDCDGDGDKDIVGEWAVEADGSYMLASCPDGHTHRKEGNISVECVACSGPHHYILRPDEDECQACPPGLVCDGTSAVASDLDGSIWEAQGGIMRLTACPSGYFADSADANGMFDATVQQCVPCPAGQDCKEGGCSNRCNSCPAGSFKDSASTDSCRLCPKNTYARNYGSDSADDCWPCPEGSVTDGEGQKDVDSCRCTGRYYRSSSPEEAVLCSYCPKAAMCGDGTCALNNPGHICNDTGLPILGTWVQNATEPGAAPGGNEEWKYKLVSCPEGSSIVRAPPWITQRCISCSPAEYILDPSSHQCQKCPPGLRCDGTQHTEPVIAGSQWSPLGFILKLTHCPANYYIHQGDGQVLDPAQQECRPCGPGTQCMTPPCFGECDACQPGSFKDTAYPEPCTKCPPATYNPSVGSSSPNDCLACFEGATTFESSGLADDSECSCPARTYKSGNATIFVCSACPVGAICLSDGSCAINNPGVACPDGQKVGTWTMTGAGGTAELASCPAATQWMSTLSNPPVPHNDQQCKQCSDSQYVIDPTKGHQCKTCPPGLICNGGPMVVFKLPGSVFAPQGDSYVLTQCPDGYHPYIQGGMDVQECQACPAGKQCVDANCSSCVPCPAGSFKDAPGPDGCTLCPHNTFGTEEGAVNATSCQACASGTQTIGEGNTMASDCICFGRQYRAGNDVCVNCPVGGICGDGTCALSFADLSCPGSSTPIVGEWIQDGPGGTYQLKSCPEGYDPVLTPQALHECVACGENEYQIDGDQTCRRCPSFASCNGGKSVQPAIQGSVIALDGTGTDWTLVSCPAHTFKMRVSIGSIDVDTCSPCPRGTECAEPPCSECVPCQPGTYKDAVSATACSPCPVNTFSSESGLNGSCTECRGMSSTEGLVGQSSEAACTCDEQFLSSVMGDGTSICKQCPWRATCPDGSCGLPSGNCPDGSEIVGAWEGPDESGDYYLTSCPAGFKFVSADGNMASSATRDRNAYCEECTRCPGSSEYCHQADYIVDQYKYSCEACPIGAMCNGAAYKPPPQEEFLTPATVWEVDSDTGRILLKSCPDGHQLVNNTGYFNQECRACPAGQSILRSDDPSLKCSKCPGDMFCGGTSEPVFSDETFLEVYISGVVQQQLQTASSAEVASILAALSESLGINIDYVLLIEVCDSETLECRDINSQAATGGARRSMALLAKEGAYDPLPEFDGDGKRRTVPGFAGKKYCDEASVGTYMRFNIQIPLLGGADPNKVHDKIVSPTYSDELDAYIKHNFETAQLPSKDTMCTQVVNNVLPGLAQGRIGWKYEIKCGEGEDRNLTDASTNITTVVKYSGEDCKPTLVSCPAGWLFINTTGIEARCDECGRGTYSFDSWDGCMVDAEGKYSCDERLCNPCPDEPVGGAICCGGKNFFELTEDSVWQNWNFTWPDGHNSIVRRIETCPPGHSLIRNDSDPTSDFCLKCPPYSYSLEGSSFELGQRSFASRQEWELAMTTNDTFPCNPCPPGSTCFGGTDITPAEGYWGGAAMLCPQSACSGEPEQCDTKLCFPVDEQGEAESSRRRLGSSLEVGGSAGVFDMRRQAEEVCGPECRLRKYVHVCPAGGCLTNGNCTPGRTGPACGICDVGHVDNGAGCVKCDSSKDQMLIVAAVCTFVPILLVIYYFFSWRDLIYTSEAVDPSVHAEKITWLEKMAVRHKVFHHVNELYKDARESLRETHLTPYIKTIISFYNIVGTYPTVFNVYWPDQLATMMMITNSIAGVDPLGLPGFNCLAVYLPYTTKLLINTLTPLAINAVFAVALVGVMIQGVIMYRGFKKHPKYQAALNRFCFTSAFSMGLYFPPVSIQVLSSFRCDDQLGVLYSDYSEACPLLRPEGFVFQWSLICTLVYPIGIPLALYGMLWMYNVPKIAKIKMNKALLKAIIAKYQAVNQTQESEILARIIGNVANREAFKERVNDLFLMIDKDGGGTLDIDELVEAFRVFGMANVDEDKIKRVLRKFNRGGDEEIDPDTFMDIVSEMTAISFLFTGHEEDLEELTIEQMRALASFDWGKLSVKRKIVDEDRDLGKKPLASMFLPDLDDPASMGPWILAKARTLRAQGLLAIPMVTWDKENGIPGERNAIDRLGVVFMEYKVEYWYYELFDMGKKIMMTSVLSFVMYGTATQLFIGFMILAASLLKILRSQPYASSALNTFQAYTYLIQCVTLLYGICIIADTDFDSASSDYFRKGWTSNIIILVVATVAFFPLGQAFLASKRVKRFVARIRKYLFGTVSTGFDYVMPSRVTKREAQSLKMELEKAAKRKQQEALARKLRGEESEESDGDDGGSFKTGSRDASKKRSMRKAASFKSRRGAQDEFFESMKPGGGVTDIEMVPGLNCGPGIFRLYDGENEPKVAGFTHSAADSMQIDSADLVMFTNPADAVRGRGGIGSSSGSDSRSCSSYTGSSAYSSDSEDEMGTTGRRGSDQTQRSEVSDLRPAPRLGPARVRNAYAGVYAEAATDDGGAQTPKSLFQGGSSRSLRAMAAADSEGASRGTAAAVVAGPALTSTLGPLGAESTDELIRYTFSEGLDELGGQSGSSTLFFDMPDHHHHH